MIVYFDKPKGIIKSLDGRFSKNVLWGDWLDVGETAPPSGKYIVKWHNWNRETDRVWTTDYLVEKADCRETPLLEMMFLDVGQGDGCIVSIPDGNRHKTIIVDAGVGDNMFRFIRWKTRGFRVDTKFHAAILTHPDQDHYKGFQLLFNRAEVSFERVYHNGLVERVTTDGTPAIGRKANGFCTDIIETRAALSTLLNHPAKRGRKLYPKLLWTALSDPGRFGDIAMLSTLHGETVSERRYSPLSKPADAHAAKSRAMRKSIKMPCGGSFLASVRQVWEKPYGFWLRAASHRMLTCCCSWSAAAITQ